MDESDGNRRTIAACEQCGALYAALELADDKLRPIGRREGCRCGSTAFSAVDDSLSGVSLEDGSGD
ncbi:hypothetical protein [Natrinema versiforme]|uniref:Uncharacterized protein n=1 Tax=Natrinema versiforme JCM 10478 TaxID=1227496 RepID=L9Y1H2_9EURY|nr:hypothetical protein [Natrinema versiforme]ELY67547.1 hypothetical protein C489_10664 [Natrinema versiforme JCM 10478]